MKRFLCGLLAVCSLFTMAVADTAQQLLWAEEMVRELNHNALGFVAMNPYEPKACEMMAEYASGDHSRAAVIYRYNIDISASYAANGVQDVTLMRYMDLSLWHSMVLTGLGLELGLSSGEVSVLSACAVSKPFVGSCGREWWVLSYWNGADILVQFMDQGNGTVLVTVSYMPVKCGPMEMMRLFEQYGIPATYEKIR